MSTEFQFSQVLQKTQEVEYALWCVLGNFGEGSFSDLQGSPINGVAVGALKEFLEKPSDLMVGIIPFYVKNFFPFTAEACNSGCHTLEEALFWADKQNSLSSPEVESPLQTFSRKYLLEAAKLALISPVGAQICFGIDHVSARALFRAGFDRWSVEILVRHFNLRFSLSGSDEALWDEFRDPVQVALVDWLLTSPKQRLVQREKFLRTVFRFADLPAGKHQSQDGVMQTADANQMLACCAAMGVALPTTQRFLQLYGMGEKEAYNAARRWLRRSKSRSAPRHLPSADRRGLLVQICRGLMNRALDGPYTTGMVIEAFMWASLAALQILRLGPIQGYEGFWVTWIEKRMQCYLRKLAIPTTNLCGAGGHNSAKNNVMGAEYAAD